MRTFPSAPCAPLRPAIWWYPEPEDGAGSLEQSQSSQISRREAAVALELVRREEPHALDPAGALALRSGPADYYAPTESARPTCGLVEQHRWFGEAAGQAHAHTRPAWPQPLSSAVA